MTIEDLKALQSVMGLAHVHLVCIEQDKFTIAHTDTERNSNVPLDGCEIHIYLEGFVEPPADEGIYVPVMEVDEFGRWYDFVPVLTWMEEYGTLTA